MCPWDSFSAPVSLQVLYASSLQTICCILEDDTTAYCGLKLSIWPSKVWVVVLFYSGFCKTKEFKYLYCFLYSKEGLPKEISLLSSIEQEKGEIRKIKGNSKEVPIIIRLLFCYNQANSSGILPMNLLIEVKFLNPLPKVWQRKFANNSLW